MAHIYRRTTFIPKVYILSFTSITTGIKMIQEKRTPTMRCNKEISERGMQIFSFLSELAKVKHTPSPSTHEKHQKKYSSFL